MGWGRARCCGVVLGEASRCMARAGDSVQRLLRGFCAMWNGALGRGKAWFCWVLQGWVRRGMVR